MTSNMSLNQESFDNHMLGQIVFNHGTTTNRNRKVEEIKLLKKWTKKFEKAIILFNSGKVQEMIEYMASVEAITGKINYDNNKVKLDEIQV